MCTPNIFSTISKMQVIKAIRDYYHKKQRKRKALSRKVSHNVSNVIC